MSHQPLVSPLEVEALRTEVRSLKEQLAAQKVYYEVQVAELTKQRDSAEKKVKELQGSGTRPKVIGGAIPPLSAKGRK